MLTKGQGRDIRSATGLSVQFQDSFDSRWADVVGRLHGSRADLGNIKIVSESDGRRNGK